jgi:hypothetical protein
VDLAMKPETDPIEENEWLLRRVRKELFFELADLKVSPDAFKPRVRSPKVRDPDIEGISLYREACLATPSDILATVPVDKQHEYAIVRVPVSLVTSLNLSVVLQLDSRVLGHVVIPELNADDYTANKARFAPIKLQLATVASEAHNILRRPVVADSSG